MPGLLNAVTTRSEYRTLRGLLPGQNADSSVNAAAVKAILDKPGADRPFKIRSLQAGEMRTDPVLRTEFV